MTLLELSFLEKLNTVHMHLRREINTKTAAFKELVHLPMDELDKTFNPAVVLAVSRACGDEGRKSEALAGIIQFMFMANQVHRLMKDNSDLAEELRQFPVLVGDFLYGKFFLDLCREKLLPFLDPLAQVMGTMSKGGISRFLAQGKKLNTEELLNIIEMECASLTKLGARLSAELAGVPLSIQKQIERFGRELGLAWGAWKEHLETTVVRSILGRANEILKEIPAGSQLELQPLKEVYQYLEDQLSIEYHPIVE